jgi:F420-dependent oxidoreductase-like protein
MKLGLALGAAGGPRGPAELAELAVEAEHLGYDSVWTAEAYGGDAATALGWLAAHTTLIGLGAGVLQIPGRTPAMTAMTAATLDLLSGGRFRLGLGVSGPAVSEGWHGVPFGSPLARTREYVAALRLALAGERLAAPGPNYPVPPPKSSASPLRLSVRPAGPLPLLLAAVGPKAVELAAEIADGWLAAFFAPEHSAGRVGELKAARAAAGRGEFAVVATVPIAVGPDARAAADTLRDYYALYVGGMGAKDRNFYNRLAVELGHGAAAAVIQERYLARDRDAAAAAVPFELIDSTALVGPEDRMAERLAAYAAAGVDVVCVWPYGQDAETAVATLRTAASALERAGVGG